MEAMDNNVLPIFSQAAFFHDTKNVGFHSHPGTELLLITSGNCEITIKNITYRCQPGDLLIIPPEEEHDQRNFGPVGNYFVVFHAEPTMFDSSPRLIKLGDDAWIEPLIREICRMSKAVCYDLCDGLIYSLVKAIRRREQQLEGLLEMHPALVKAVRLIEKDFARQLSMDEIAVFSGISKSYLRTLFIRHFGYSPQLYLQNFRMARAREALQNRYLTVEEVATECGYTDASYFTRLFHKIHHCTPSAFRKVIQEHPRDAFIRY